MEDNQLGLNFDGQDNNLPTGLDDWRAARRNALESLARTQGLPIGRIARIYFHNGPPCEGVLLLDEDHLFFPEKRTGASLKLAVGRIRFTAGDIASCIAIED